MIADRDTDRILRTWFQEEAAPLPERVLDAVIDGLPRVRQRRRGWSPMELSPGDRAWLRLALVAVVLLALAAGLLLVGSRLAAAPPRLLPRGEEIPLEPGPYVIQGTVLPPTGIRVPPGWVVAELTNDWMGLAREEPSPRSEIVMTYVEALYLDPCHPEAGIRDDVGASVDDLAGALSQLPNVGASAVEHIAIDGRAAAAVTLHGPSSVAGCSEFEPALPVWGAPQHYGLYEGGIHRILVTDPGLRIVIATYDHGPGTPGALDVEAMLASIDFDAAPLPVPTDTPAPPGSPWPTLPVQAAVPPGEYRFPVQLFSFDVAGRQLPVPGRLEAAFAVHVPGWFGTQRGVVLGEALPAAASLSIWTIATVPVDPCHWRTGPGAKDPRAMRDLDLLAGALSSWAPSASSPRASAPLGVIWIGSSRTFTLEVPEIDLEDCDGGEYHLWEDPTGAARTAQPGEHIVLWIADAHPGLMVLEAADLPSASAAERDAVGEMAHTMWVGPQLIP
jgi:hypothetical protein